MECSQPPHPLPSPPLVRGMRRLNTTVGFHGVYTVAAALGDGSDMGSHSPWLSVLNVMSGGVFVAAGFMHLLPEAEEDLRELSEECNFEVGVLFCDVVGREGTSTCVY